MLDDLEPEGPELEIVPLEAKEEAGTEKAVTKEVPTHRGLEEGIHEAIEVDIGGEEVCEAHLILHLQQ